MKKFVIATICAVLIGCGSQVVEFPEEGNAADGGSQDAGSDSGNEAGACCSDDLGCPGGQVCKGGTCTPVDPCDGVSCPDDATCKDGQCVVPDPCDGVVCDGGTCSNGKCVKTNPKDPCEDVCCPDNKECKDGKCVPKDPCAGVTCPDSRVCKNGACVCAGDEPDNHNSCGKKKVLICHFPHSGKKHNLCVSYHAVPAHICHGDKPGDCSKYH